MVFQRNAAFNKHYYFKNRIVNSIEQIKYGVINITFCATLDHEITLKILEFILNLIEKVNLASYFLQCVYFLNQTGQNPNLTAFTSKIQIFCRQYGLKGGPHTNEL